MIMSKDIFINKKNCVIATNSLWNALNFRLGLMRYLKKLGYQVFILAPAQGDRNQEILSKEGFQVYNINLNSHGKNPLRELYLLYEYYRAIKKISPKFILSFTIKPNIYASIISKILNIPIVNNITGLGSAFLKKTPLQSFIKFLYKLIYKYSFVVFCQNIEDRNFAINTLNLEPSKVKLLPGSGVDLKKFFYVDPVTNKKFKFLFVGRILKAKGVVELIEASKLLSANENMCINFIGDIDKYNPDKVPKKIIDKASTYNNISFLGPRSDVREAMSNADCIVLPSYSEGSPKSLIEAAAIGRPLIGTDIAGIRPLISNDQNGFLCKPKDIESLMRAMQKMLKLSQHERKKMGKLSRNIVELNYDESIVISKYISEVQAICIND